MKFENKAVWGMVGVSVFTSITLILRYFREKDKTDEKQREFELMRETEKLAQKALEENSKKLDQAMKDILAKDNEYYDKKMEEFKRQIEESKKNDEFKKQVERLTMTANKLIDEGS